MEGSGVRIFLFYLLKFGIYSVFPCFLQFVFPGDTCVSHGVAGRALLDTEHPVSYQAPAMASCPGRFVLPVSVRTRSIWGLRNSPSSLTSKYQRSLQTHL